MQSADMGCYRDLVEGAPTGLWPHLRVTDNGTDSFYNDVRRKALGFYDAGAIGVAIWDTNNVGGTSVKGPLPRRIGHVDEMRARVAEGLRKELTRKMMHALGDEDMRVAHTPETHAERIMPDGYTKHHFTWFG